MDQGGEAGGTLDTTVVSSVPGERGPVAAGRAGVQPRESVAAARAGQTDRQLVTHQRAAAPRQDGRAVGQIRTLLLAPAGGGSSDAPAVRGDAPADLGLTGPDRLTGDH